MNSRKASFPDKKPPSPIHPSTPKSSFSLFFLPSFLSSHSMEFLSQQSPQEHDDQTGNLRELMIIDTKRSGEVVQIQNHDQEEETNMTSNKKCYMFLLGINYILLFVGSILSFLLSKFYFNHKGDSRWVSTWAQSAGFPLLLLPIYLPFYIFKSTHRKPFTNFTPKILLLSICIDFFLGLNNLLFSWGNSYLPDSTNSLILSSQLVFTLITLSLLSSKKSHTWISIVLFY